MSSIKNTPADPEITRVFSLFFDGAPVSADVIDTGTGEDDFRNTVIVTASDGEKYVIKIVANSFTFPERIRMWQRTIGEYRKLGYYCPRILCARDGDFPAVEYRGHKCIAYAEEFSKYAPLEDRMAEGEGADASAYFADIWSMTAKIAAKKLDYTDYPSGYCLFETFSSDEEVDEVTDNALEWKKTADALPEAFRAQTERIWRLWSENREKLREIYPKLPTSVFQADLNPTNLLIDGSGRFAGVYDFNLCGRDVFLNYLMRENYESFEKEIGLIQKALRIAGAYYEFSDEEKAAAPLLFRCIKPLWYNRVEELKEAGGDEEKIRRSLERTEHYLTADIDLAGCMEKPAGNAAEALLDEFTVRKGDAS